ncbi:MBL fold metallo-hydrolase [Desulfonatronospira sp.]|uniref:MBL fold metallo-hydrolase n=1 Tax=Desulfonatronospira sp. TaxID=1962951 RepID=UPI0025C24B5B|nr:MBL fold metallo-hydrolase [Desulfonatronospira sp.]
MLIEKIKSEGLSHLSYLIIEGGYGAVVDPRRDCRIYMDMAYEKGAQIKYIFETHRNEDYVIGSVELSHMTGAQIYHGAELPFAYGNTASDGDVFEFGQVRLKVMKTPGHTFESISLVLYDKAFSPDPIGIFTGDALFIGDVGRTDFFPDRKEESAGLLYDSIFNKILPLGDQVLLYPGHGAGSVCGSGMADREFSTLGFEKRNNNSLQFKNKEEFVRFKTQEKHSLPPYFSRIEDYNLNGPPALEPLYPPKPMPADHFEEAMQKGMLVVDTRSPEAFAGAYIPGSLAIPLHMLPAYAGWFLPYDTDLGLIVESYQDLDTAQRYLARIGYDRVMGFLEKGLHEWAIRGKFYETIPAVHAGELQRRIRDKQDFTILDVRTREEFAKGHLPGAQHIYLGHMPESLNDIGSSRPVTTFCGSGQRAIIAASILKKNGFKDVEDCLGSVQACSRGVCELVRE